MIDLPLHRFDLADLHHPVVLAKTIHKLTGDFTCAIPVEAIAYQLDVAEVRLDTFDGFEGMLLTDASRSTGCILANTSKGTQRARFTLAHELGHFLMEKHQLSNSTGFTCTKQDLRETREGRKHVRQETQANQFAIELLAPDNLVKPILANVPDLRDAQRLRNHLDISLEACIRRMISRRHEELAAIWTLRGHVRYFVKTDGFPFIALNRGDRIAQATPAFRAITRGRPGYTQFVDTDPYPWTGNSNLELREQSRISGNGYAVTLLWAELVEDDDIADGPPELGTPRFR